MYIYLHVHARTQLFSLISQQIEGRTHIKKSNSLKLNKLHSMYICMCVLFGLYIAAHMSNCCQNCLNCCLDLVASEYATNCGRNRRQPTKRLIVLPGMKSLGIVLNNSCDCSVRLCFCKDLYFFCVEIVIYSDS